MTHFFYNFICRFWQNNYLWIKFGLQTKTCTQKLIQFDPCHINPNSAGIIASSKPTKPTIQLLRLSFFIVLKASDRRGELKGRVGVFHLLCRVIQEVSPVYDKTLNSAPFPPLHRASSIDVFGKATRSFPEQQLFVEPRSWLAKNTEAFGIILPFSLWERTS